MQMHQVRAEFLNRLKGDLLGPRRGETEFLPASSPPTDIYSLGILYPRVESAASEAVDSGGMDEDLGSNVAADQDQDDDSPLAPILQKRPASAGMTFALESGSRCRLSINGGAYATAVENGVSGWLRRQLAPTAVELDASRTKEANGLLILGGMATLRVRWRHLATCDVVTVSVVSAAQPTPKNHKPLPDECLFQLGVTVKCIQGKFHPQPAPSFVVDEEEAELRLRYKHNQAWASGHGCSVNWDLSTSETPDQISIDFLPVSFVPRFTAEPSIDCTFDTEALSIERLATIESPNALNRLLVPFVEDFARWLKNCACLEKNGHEEAFDRVISRLEEQLRRLRHGVAFLTSGDQDAFEAFRIGNAAILDQMSTTAARKGDTFIISEARWRPFQLAFMLLAAPGAVRDEPEDSRNIVDLIWFPTGGGKTEAYLLLVAFVISHRRLANQEEGGGTAVISRYTLRLLTQDQFTRTATLICCLERLRRSGRIPGEEISIGLWLGADKERSTKRFLDAKNSSDKILAQETPKNPFHLERCPACSQKIVPDRLSEKSEDYGFNATLSSFGFHCPSAACDFHSKLPIQVVHAALYEKPPTVLLGTIDMFAQLSWDGRCRSFFGFQNKTRKHAPPSLVIQDELHLISGPLGTIAAIYETAIDAVFDYAGQRPKYVAATATIRNARDQAKKLYGRSTFVFPSPGVAASDSYYMREDPNLERARAYVGYMGQGHTPVSSSVHVLASSLLAGKWCTNADDYWTLVAYHNSRRELGKTMTLARDDVPLRIEALEGNDEGRTCEEVFELSSNVQTHLLPSVLHKMGLDRDTGEAMDLVACTNMISVGVDIPRLNLMVVMGQPKTASEYIQASSRVGRSSEAAGLIIVNFAATKPRDRAHYESFPVFHDGYYRWVEPSSVTPESPMALDRALHAAIIAATRLVVLLDNDDASGFDPSLSPDQSVVIESLRERLRSRVSPESWQYVEARFEDLIRWWVETASEHPSLRYHARSGTQFVSLIKRFDQKLAPPSRQTLLSMRNVEGSARFLPKGAGTGGRQ